MKILVIIITTAAVETAVLWAISLFFDWHFIDIMLLGGLLIFGAIWLLQLYSNQTNNHYHAFSRIDNRQETPQAVPFYFKISPLIYGLLLFNLMSFVITVVKFYPYFID
ncbi:hypothetical protein BN1080_02395 [Planococcus massiliensis]|uniref:DUF3899 domain-containing protein n=1 Tax=Planococcus massiliensis TaxID=1499687 RepID=A0A098EM71_9BACL|nr:hypothetical protein [Planococcus massiliensis]CEG23419.1 hypothetical protein BN1080_02395 [Planococcus massiliensis]